MRIAIAGASMAGLFAAALLQRAGHEILLFERSRLGLQGRGAGLVAQPDMFTFLRQIGRDDVADLGVVARERITLDRAGVVIQHDPHPQLQISWDHLYVSLRMAIGDVCYHSGRAVVAAGQDEDGAWLQFGDGDRAEADLIIGADGIGSAVRQHVTGFAPDPAYAGYVAWRALLPESLLPAASAEALSDRFAFHHMSGGQALGYTVAGGQGELEQGQRRYNAVWYRRTPDLRAALTDGRGRIHPYSLPPGGVSDANRAKLISDAHRLLPLPFAQVFASEPQPFVQAIFDLETPRMQRGRAALIGDAAFVVRPHTAMGVAKAAGDAMALARAIEQDWSEPARAGFERQRMAFGQSVVAYGRRLGASLM